jgi:hypothetical protein
MDKMWLGSALDFFLWRERPLVPNVYQFEVFAP